MACIPVQVGHKDDRARPGDAAADRSSSLFVLRIVAPALHCIALHACTLPAADCRPATGSRTGDQAQARRRPRQQQPAARRRARARAASSCKAAIAFSLTFGLAQPAITAVCPLLLRFLAREEIGRVAPRPRHASAACLSTVVRTHACMHAWQRAPTYRIHTYSTVLLCRALHQGARTGDHIRLWHFFAK